jgi:curved DNA-binding protein CbpA
MNIEDALRIIGVQNSADFEEIRSVYRDLVKRWHPDRHVDPAAKLDAEARLKKINEAFSYLESVFANSEQSSEVPHDAGSSTDSTTTGDDRDSNPRPFSADSQNRKTSSQPWAARFGLAVLAMVLLSSFGKALSKTGQPQATQRIYNTASAIPSNRASATPSITGRWLTSKGDVVSLSETGVNVTIELLSSPNMSNGYGLLRRSGNALAGSLSGTFDNSPSGQITSPFEGVITNTNRIDYVVDAVNVGRNGRVRSRNRVAFYMTRI